MIQWGEFAAVLGVALAATVLLTLTYSGFIRLIAVARPESGPTNDGAMAGAIVCLVLAALTVLFGLWLVIPQLHPWFK